LSGKEKMKMKLPGKRLDVRIESPMLDLRQKVAWGVKTYQGSSKLTLGFKVYFVVILLNTSKSSAAMFT
jgi:hypothetical protein